MRTLAAAFFILIAQVLMIAPVATGAEIQQSYLKTGELRVGVTPHSPPMIFKMGSQIAGVEADLARDLASALGVKLTFVELRWSELIQSLVDGKIDIVMSDMSTTQARKVRVAFAEPYLQSGLVAAFRITDAKKYATTNSILESFAQVGVVAGTTGEVFVRTAFKRTQRIAVFPDIDNAIHDLRNNSVDIVVYDAPMVAWMVSENEAQLAYLPQFLTHEDIAWALRPGDQALLQRVNQVLAEWKGNRRLDAIITKWMPYWGKK